MTATVADSTVALKFIKSPWSTPCLVLNDFLYNCHSTRGDIGYWRCHNYSRRVKEERCRARCVVKNGRFSAFTGAQHNHPPHTEKINRIVARNHADELQEQEMMRIQQQQQQHQNLQRYQQVGDLKSQANVQQTGEDILLLMTAAPPPCPTAAVNPQVGTEQGTHQISAPLISPVASVIPPAITDLIKMEEYELPTVEL